MSFLLFPMTETLKMLMTTLFENINQDQALVYVVIRSFILFSVGIIVIRYGNRRYNLSAAFDYLSLVILGGLISRGINGSATLVSTLVAVFSLIVFHRLIATITYYSITCEKIFKGKSHLIIKNGELQHKNLHQYHITENDLLIEMHRQLHIDDLREIDAAYLEGTGRITFIYNKNN